MVLLLSLSGCQNQQDNQSSPLKQQDPVQNISYSGGPNTTQKSSNQDLENGGFGYVHYQRDPDSNPRNIADKVPKIDPQELSDVITRLELTMPDVYDVATLTTDRHILIGYKTKSHDRNKVASQVKQTAYSVTPRYYDIYISDKSTAINEISQYQHLSVQTPRVHDWLQSLIKEMKKSPQGNLKNNNNMNKEM